MIRKIIPLFFAALVLSTTACSDDKGYDEITIAETQREPMTAQEIKTKIDESVQAGVHFTWRAASTRMVWSAILKGNKLATIGFGMNAQQFDRTKTSQAQNLQEQLVQMIAHYEGKTKEEVLMYSDPFLNLFDVYIEKQETVEALRRSSLVRYVEPADFRYFSVADTQMAPESSTSSGCGYDAQTLNASDFTTVTPNARVPWTFNQHQIPAAWAQSTGRGITIGIVDTGTSPSQSLLGSNFNNGASTGRSIQKFGTFVDSIWPWSTTTDGPNDRCGHGTSMAWVAAAPRNDRGLPVGVAYNANLITYRAASNVVLDGYHEQNGVKNAFTALGNNPAVRIISMSMGHIFSVGRIEDGVRYAHSRGKLIFCAGGTSTSFTNFVGVIFPAWMPEVVAVTGVKEGTSNQKCDVCHSGSEIQFTVQMQRSASGNTVPVGSYYENLSDYVGGSSVATATTAGIAALVWSKNPTWNRDQVLAKMRQSATYFPSRNSQYGFGNINASLAVQ